MLSILRSKLLKDTAIYSSINILEKAVPFLIMPIISRAISKEEMGYYALYQVTFQILIPILTLCLDYPVIVSFYSLAKDAFAKYFSTAVYLMLGVYIILVVIAIIFKSGLSLIFGLEEKWLFVTIVIVLLNYINHLRLNMWRITKNTLSYGVFSIPLTLLKNILGLFFILVLKRGWEGIIMGHLIGQVIFSAYALFSLSKDGYLKKSFDSRHVNELLTTGVPVSINSLSTWFSTSLNRLIINSILGASATGSFGIGSTFGVIITVLEDACNKAYAPYLYEKLANFDDIKGRWLVKVIRLYYLFFISVGLLISTLGYFGVGWIFGDKYLDTRSFIVPIALASVINGLYKVHVNFIYFSKKTYIIAGNTIICAMVNLAICYFLVYEYGILGAAYAAIIVQLLLYVLTVYQSNRLYKLPWMTVFKI